MSQIKPNVKPPTSPEEVQNRKAFDEANNIVKSSSIWEALFGAPDDERTELRNALMLAILNKPKLETNVGLNEISEQYSNNKFKEIADTFLGVGLWGNDNPAKRENSIKQLSEIRHHGVVKSLPEFWSDRPYYRK